MKQTISFQVEQSLVEQLKAKATEQMLTPSALLRIILVRYLKNNAEGES
jgi:hypothetical protein